MLCLGHHSWGRKWVQHPRYTRFWFHGLPQFAGAAWYYHSLHATPSSTWCFSSFAQIEYWPLDSSCCRPIAWLYKGRNSKCWIRSSIHSLLFQDYVVLVSYSAFGEGCIWTGKTTQKSCSYSWPPWIAWIDKEWGSQGTSWSWLDSTYRLWNCSR